MREIPVIYAVKNSDNRIRINSSSGGIFYNIAKFVIEQNGVVFGVEFDRNFNACHTYTTTLDGVKRYTGSKYIQSNVGNSYINVRQFLEEKKLVLFSGTPCQVEGLYVFLGKYPENLITVDFVCHGVPSPIIWQEYINEMSNGKGVVGVSFRDKTEGWQKFSLKLDFYDGSNYHKNQYEDLYLKGFLSDIYLRPSCYKCRFKGTKRISDFTLADFWGVRKFMPEFDDDGGVSLVLVQSSKGESYWNEISSDFKYQKVGYSAIQENPNAFKSVALPKKRKKFMTTKKMPIQKRILNCTEQSKFSKVTVKFKCKIKKEIKKFFR